MLKIVLAQWMNTAFIIYFINSISEAPNEDYINQVREKNKSLLLLLRLAVRLLAFLRNCRPSWSCVSPFTYCGGVPWLPRLGDSLVVYSGTRTMSVCMNTLYVELHHCCRNKVPPSGSACPFSYVPRFISEHEGAPGPHPRLPLSLRARQALPSCRDTRCLVQSNHSMMRLVYRPINSIVCILCATQVHPNAVSNVSPRPNDGQISKILWADAFTQPLVKVLDLPNRFKQYILAPMAKTQVSPAAVTQLRVRVRA